MPTLRDLLESGNLGGSEKTASVAEVTDTDGMDKLAMQLGLFGDTEKVAEFPPAKKDDDKKEEEEEEEGEKKASAGGLHAALFPNSILGGAEKTAAEKQAAAEEALGGLAYDRFAATVDSFITKLASEVVSENPHGDSQAENRLPNNKGDSRQAIDTTPSVTNMLPPKNDAGTVGHYEAKHVKAAALRKQMLLAALDQ